MKKSWFQISLSTVIMLSLLAGVFLWINTIPHYANEAVSGKPREYIGIGPPTRTYGWPRSFCETGGMLFTVHEYHYVPILVDVAVLAGIELVAAILFEYIRRALLRRRMGNE
jgi:hypothetical protein